MGGGGGGGGGCSRQVQYFNSDWLMTGLLPTNPRGSERACQHCGRDRSRNCCLGGMMMIIIMIMRIIVVVVVVVESHSVAASPQITAMIVSMYLYCHLDNKIR